MPNPTPSVNPEPAPTPPVPAFQVNPALGFDERGKLPQIVRDLPDFTGNPRDLSQWILDVEDVLELYEDMKPDFRYHLVVKTIRRKIKGEASEALITSNTPTNWCSIKDVLRLYYADKRDLMTLDHQLKSLARSKHESIESYYSRVREMMSLISSAVILDEQWKGHEQIIIKLYNQISLDTFIRGLGDPLSRFCKNYRPQSLAQAFSYCVDYLNLDARNAPVHFDPWRAAPTPVPRQSIQINKPVLPPRQFNAPPAPPRQYNAANAPPRHNYQPFPQPNYNTPQPFQRNFPTNVFAPNRTFHPLMKRPEPMEVDQSIRSKNVNYGNRPPIAARREASNSMRMHDPHPKRFAHLTENMEPEHYQDAIENEIDEIDECYSNPPTEYLETDESPESHPSGENEGENETNFLETGWSSKWFS